MSKTTRIATCPFADTYENLRDDNPILRNGQRVYDTKNKQWYTGDGITAFNDLIADDGEIDLSGYQTIENLSDNYRNEGPSPDNAYLSIAGAQAMFNDLMMLQKSDEEIIAIVNDIEKNSALHEINAVNEVVSLNAVIKNYKTLSDFFSNYDNFNDVQDNILDASHYSPTGSIINIESGVIPRLIVKEIIPGSDSVSEAIYFENEEVTAAVINEKLEQDGYFYTQYTKFEKLCNGQGGSEILQEELDRLYYYGDKNIVPTDNSHFIFYEDENYITLNKSVPDTVIIPYKFSNGNPVTMIENDGYSHENIKTIILPNSVTILGIEAFSNLPFTKIILSKNLEMINSYAFMSCSNLSEIVIPETVTKIFDGAFSDCEKLSKVYILKDNVIILSGAFANCSSDLTIICNPGSTAEAYAKENGIKYAYNYVKSEDLGGSSISQEELERLNYYGNKDIIPSDENLFIFYPNDDKTASISLKEDIDRDSITELVIPYKYIDDNEKEYKITDISNWALSECRNLTSVTIPNSVIGIWDYSFKDCINLTNITIPNSVTSIDNSAFYNCSGLTSITIPNSVTSITVHAFCDCSSLTSIDIPDSVTSIGEMAFQNCSEDLTIICNPCSYAENYAKENGIKYAYNYVDINSLGDSSKEIYITEESGFIVTNEDNAYENSNKAVIIGIEGFANGDEGVILGHFNQTDNGVTIGSGSLSMDHGIAIGNGAISETGIGIGSGVITNGIAIGHDAYTALEEDYGEGPEVGDTVDAIQIGSGWNKQEHTFQVYDYQLLDTQGKIPEERISNMFYLDGDNLKINIGGKTFTLTPDAE